jgi:hypothetical protein
MGGDGRAEFLKGVWRPLTLTVAARPAISLPRMSSESTTRSRSKRDKEKARGHEPDTATPAEFAPERNGAEAYTERYNAVLVSIVSLFLIGFGVWLVSGTKRYREEYAQSMEGWRVGTTRMVELTLVKDDKTHLGCASDQEIAGLRCGHRRNKSEAVPAGAADPRVLQPFNTVGNELLLGAGLWNSPDLKGALPSSRFSVICNYTIKGVVKSVSIRFNPTAAFAPVGKTVTAGTLSECVLPR